MWIERTCVVAVRILCILMVEGVGGEGLVEPALRGVVIEEAFAAGAGAGCGLEVFEALGHALF
jgi:hypothetical protein